MFDFSGLRLPRTLLILISTAALLLACNPENEWQTPDGSPPGDSGPDGYTPTAADADGDGISDVNEGRAAEVDTDLDGTPDYLDTDSDGDGLPDALESGTGGNPDNPPVDSDSDGTHDFRDLDSDDNGILDAVEGGADTDLDGLLDNADSDNDGDHIDDITEIGPSPSAPLDSDGDGTHDYMDLDSDADFIADEHESDVDTDADGIPDYLDPDTDNDGIPDSVEAGDADIATAPVDTDGDLVPDFRDTDSDNDGLSDADEVAAGTNPVDDDSDDDGVTDLVEVAADTDPLDPGDSPRTRGDFVFLVPYEADPDPTEDTLSFSTDIQFADVYFLVDCTGSMGGELTNLKSSLSGTIIPGIEAAIPNVQFGVGRFEDYPYGSYGGSSDRAYQHLQSMTDSVAAAQAAVNSLGLRSGADGPESHVPALHAMATGCGDGGGIGVGDDPAGACTDPALIGYPHFRSGAVPVVVLITDAPSHNGPSGNAYGGIPGVTPPAYAETIAALNAIHARVIGVNSGATYGGPDLRSIATDTGTVDATGTPLVYDIGYDGTGMGAEIITAIGDVANAIPMDIAARGVDDPSDAVDAMVFVDRIVPAAATPAPCTAGLTVAGDAYVDVLPGATVCFDIIPTRNETVAPTTEPQIFMATVQVWGDDVTMLDERDVYFLVPPVIEGPGGPD